MRLKGLTFQKGTLDHLEAWHWKVLFLPILISAALAAFMIGACYVVSSTVSTWFFLLFVGSTNTLPSWIRIALLIAIFLVQLGPCYVVFRSLVLLCYTPFPDRIAKGANCRQWACGGGRKADATDRRPVLMTVYSVGGSRS